MKVQLVPTLLVYSFFEFKTKLKLCEPFFSLVQIDIIDGKFTKNKTFFDYEKIKSLKTPLFYELHLMVLNPQKFIKKWENFKKVKRIIFHYESFKNDEEVSRLIGYLKKRKINFGLAVNPETNFSQFKKFLPDINLIFILGVIPGWPGQKFQKKVLKKIKKIKKTYPKIDIEIDGGVNLKNIEKIVKSGVNIVSGASLFFKSKDIKETINQIKKIVQKV